MELRLFQTIGALGSAALTVVVFELIRRRRLTDELWLPWLVIAIGPFVACLWTAPWATLARWMGIAYEPALLLGAGILMCVGIMLYLTVVVSTLMQRSLVLAQQVALLEERLRRLDG
jgi:hypothetical protein